MQDFILIQLVFTAFRRLSLLSMIFKWYLPGFKLHLIILCLHLTQPEYNQSPRRIIRACLPNLRLSRRSIVQWSLTENWWLKTSAEPVTGRLLTRLITDNRQHEWMIEWLPAFGGDKWKQN
jgi:hypothetical protein